MCTSISCSINISSLQCSFLWKMFVKCLWFSLVQIIRPCMSLCLPLCPLRHKSYPSYPSYAPYSTPSLYSPTQVPGGKRGILLGVEGFHGGRGGEQEGGISLCELCLHFNSQYHACIVSVIQSVSSLKSYQRVVMNLIMIYNLSVMLLECLSVSS